MSELISRGHFLWPLFFLVSVACADYSNPRGARRDAEVKPFLAVSVRVNNGSGTIVHHDRQSKVTYVLTCAHIIQDRQEIELYSPAKIFEAELVAVDRKRDLSVLRFTADRTLDYCAIAPEGTHFEQPNRKAFRTRVIVCGRDGGTEPAAYEAFIVYPTSKEFVESRQFPSQGGRSGGGVFTEDRRWLIAVNVRRRDFQFTKWGTGLWVPLYKIRAFLDANDLEWLVEENLPNRLPVLDQNGKEITVPNFLPVH